MKVRDFILTKSLGKGTMGEVFLSQKEGSNKYYATKKIDKKNADRPQVRKYFITEISLLRELKHPKIISLVDIIQTGSHYYIVMDYCNGGSLLNCLKKYKKKYNKPFSEKIVQYIMKQIVSGLKYIHRKGIIHRDIKLDNILVKFYNKEDMKSLNMLNTHIKICDFGISIKPGDKQYAYTAIGSPANMDPFILNKLVNRNDLKNSEGYDQSADIWSLGSSCYEMLIGKRVFSGRNIKDLNKKVEEGNYTMPMNLSMEVVSFINGMLQYNPKKRMTCEELSRHHFLTRDVKNFHPIDFSLIYDKLDEKGIIINAKENKTIWKVFNENNEDEMIKKSLENNENMWNVFNYETKTKLNSIPIKILDQTPYEENFETTNNNTNNITNNITNNNNTNNITNNITNNNIENNNHNNQFIQQTNNTNINNNNFYNNYNYNDNNNNQINSTNNFQSIKGQGNPYNTQINPKIQHYNNNYNMNNTNNINYNINSSNTQIQINDLSNNFHNMNLGKTHINTSGYNLNSQNINQNNSSSLNPQINNIRFHDESSINPQLSKTQINDTNYPGDIKIKKQIASTDESCLHQ